jgi:diacylglycerol kinase family enzyme
MAGAGFDGEVVGRLNIVHKRSVGKIAYVGPVLGALSMPLPRLEVEADGQHLKAAWVVVTKARCYGGKFAIAPSPDLRQAGLTVVLMSPRSKGALIRQLLALVSGRLWRDRDTRVLKCKSVRVRAATAARVQIDGDPFGTTPLDIEAGGTHLRLIVPEAYKLSAVPK